MKRARPTWLPDAVGEELLRVALLPDERGRAAWSRLRPSLDLDAVDHEQLRILPLVGRTLRALGIDDPYLPRLRGIRRVFWSRNQMLVAATAPVLDALERRGIATMVLKGVPLALTCYRDLGLRPMEDLDVLVPFDRALDAVASSTSWASPGRRWRRRSSSTTTGAPGVTPTGRRWTCTGCSTRRSRCRAIRRHGPTTSGPGPSPWRWAGWSRAPPARPICCSTCACTAPGGAAGRGLRWVADAVTVLAAVGDRVDWARLVEQASRRGATPFLSDTLGYVAETFDAPVPPAVLAELRAARPGPRLELAYRIRTGPAPVPGRLGGLPITAGGWLCLTANQPLPAAVGALPGYLARAWRITGWRDAPARVSAKASTALRRRSA